ncbi:MAG: iron-sulfur cluster assembly accessory protein, partial [Actinobacteria bacterium]|nr:iron-sulfur cluster assembly accessory protein [Actinomycetota bacterium]
MISVTDSAANKVKQLLEAEGDTEMALRVAVRPGGCSGFSYEMYFDGDINGDDIKHDVDGVRVVTDPGSAKLLNGAVLDYKDG